MGPFKTSLTLTVTLSALLAGCATQTPMRDDATLFSPAGHAGDKTAPKAGAALADLEPSLDLDGALRQAQTQRKMGDLTGATRTLSQMVLVAPDDPRVLGEYGKALVAQGRSDDALAFLERATELQPSDWSLFSAQGVAYDQKGQYGQAQTAYAHALALKPGEPAVLSNNALSHIQSGDLDEAERLLREAAISGADYPRIASNLALVQSLKTSRMAAVPAPALATQPTPPLSAPVAGLPEPEAAPVPPAAIADIPVNEIPLPVVQLPADAAAPEAPAPRAAIRSADLKPAVRMQKVPADPLAGPVARKQASLKKPPAETKAPLTVAKAKPEVEQASLLRPTLDRVRAN